MLAALPRAQVKLQTGPKGFHTKYYMFGRGPQRTCWVGSSNFTKSGLFASVEWNTRHDEPETVADCEALFAELWERADVIPASDEAIVAYERTHQAAQFQLAVPLAPVGVQPTAPEPNTAQREAMVQLARLRHDGARRAAVIAATGVGKTLLAAFDAGALAQELGRRPAELSVLFTAHRDEILQQACAAYRRVHPEMATGLLVSGQRPGHARVVFATVQSLRNSPELLSRTYDQVVIDEFHHAAADSYRAVLGRLHFHFLLGLTATPERADGHDVLELCDYNVAYEVRLPEAINQGWLIPFHYFGIADNVDYAPIPWRNGGFDPEILEHALLLESRTDLILHHALEKGYDGRRRATVGFCAGVRHARYMAETLSNRGFRAEAITGTVPPAERQRLYADFADPTHPLEWLFVADVLNEGIDLPVVNALLFLRPTQSPGLFLQQLGRGLRHHPGTDVLTVLDFVGHHQNALLPLQALSQDALRLVSPWQSLQAPPFNLPQDCAVILEDQTEAILLKVQRELPAARGKAAHVAAYRQLRAELGRPPEVMDFWRRPGMPEFRELRRTFGSWILCRIQMGDADDWERQVVNDSNADALLQAVESNLQFQRVGPYATLWALAFFPDEPARGIQAFFDHFPQWLPERDVDVRQAMITLEKKQALATVLRGDVLEPALLARLRTDPRLAQEVGRRLEYTLACDYAERHGGVLRTPDMLTRYHGYRRSEIVNHLGVQYDPARHNTGVVRVGKDIALLTQLDTRDARAGHRYQNHFLEDRHSFSWESQNRMVPEQSSGQAIAEHLRLGHTLHLFVQPGGSGLYFYLGAVVVTQIQGRAPFTAILRLDERLPQSVEERLLG